MARLKRFAVIGDVHAEDESLAAVLEARVAERYRIEGARVREEGHTPLP